MKTGPAVPAGHARPAAGIAKKQTGRPASRQTGPRMGSDTTHSPIHPVAPFMTARP